MEGSIYIKALLPATILATAIAATVLSSSPQNSRIQNQSIPLKDRGQTPDLQRWPLADYNAALPSDPGKRVKRQATNKHFDKSEWPIVPTDIADSTVRLHQINTNLPAFPVQDSTVIVIGRIANAAAFLSNDKTGVYSEFTVVVENVFKDVLAEQLTTSSSITVTREGGRVCFPSGRVHWYGIGGQGMPQVANRYVLFLTGESVESLTILTGYELSGGKVLPLDDLNNPKNYLGADEAAFLGSLKASISSP